MRKLSFASLIVVAVTGSVSAQPGQDPPPAPEPAPYPAPPPAPYPPPQQLPPPGYVPPPQGYIPVQLTADDQQLLQKGEISEGAHVGGVVTSLLFGFGVGQAVQGRYGETGWIFTLGEAASMAALMYGILHSFDSCFDSTSSSCNDDVDGIYIVGGLVGLLGFRVWEIVDAVGGPSKHNRKVRELKMRLGIPVPMYTHRVVPYINKTRDGGGTAGVMLRF
jgi:hypothetical protein